VIIEVDRILLGLWLAGQQLFTTLGFLSSLSKTSAELRLENLALRQRRVNSGVSSQKARPVQSFCATHAGGSKIVNLPAINVTGQFAASQFRAEKAGIAPPPFCYQHAKITSI
jgi:hypothetical protein